jgi:hypothetical protein
VTVWVLVVSAFLSVGGGRTALLGQGRQQRLATFVFPTRQSCEAAKEGVREFAQTANQTLLIGECQEDVRPDG